IVIDRDGRCLAETMYFTMGFDPSAQGNALGCELNIPVDHVQREFEDVFLGFDAAWMNYFHWLCSAVAKSWMAAQFLPVSSAIVIPDYAARANQGPALLKPLAYSEEVWRSSLDLAGLSNRVIPLPAGVYRSRRIHLIELEHDFKSHILDMDL